jgi:hypothetical protein
MTVSTNPIIANGYSSLTGDQVSTGATGVLGWKPGGTLVDPTGGVVSTGGSTSQISLSANRLITAADDGAVFSCSTALTITIPAGLSPRPSFAVDCPPTGSLTIAVSGGALINGATVSLTRSRATNPAGVVVLSHLDADSYGVSGA